MWFMFFFLLDPFKTLIFCRECGGEGFKAVPPSVIDPFSERNPCPFCETPPCSFCSDMCSVCDGEGMIQMINDWCRDGSIDGFERCDRPDAPEDVLSRTRRLLNLPGPNGVALS